MVLHFDFMLAIILWDCGLASLWIVFAYNVNPELLVLGLFPAKTPQELRAVTLRGHEEQRQLMWVKVLFVVVAYVGTVVATLFYAGYHLKRFEELDGEEWSMRDFAVVCTGLPIFPGTELIDEEIREALAKATGQEVAGVSVCWDYSHRMDDVEEALEQDAMELQREREGPPLEVPAQINEHHVPWVRCLRQVDRFFYCGLEPASTDEQLHRFLALFDECLSVLTGLVWIAPRPLPGEAGALGSGYVGGYGICTHFHMISLGPIGVYMLWLLSCSAINLLCCEVAAL